MRGLAISCAALATAVVAAPADAFSVRSGLFPPSPVTQGGRNQNAEPGTTVDGGGTFFAAGNISGFNPRQEPRGGTAASGIDIWRSTDGARSFRWVASPFNPVTRLPGLGGDDVDIGAAKLPNAGGHYNVYAVSTDVATTLLAISEDGGTTWSVSPPGSISISVADRPWVVADGPCRFYLVYHNFSTDVTLISLMSACASDLQNGSSAAVTQLRSATGDPAPGESFGHPGIDQSSARRGTLYVPELGCAQPNGLGYEVGRLEEAPGPCRSHLYLKVYRYDGSRLSARLAVPFVAGQTIPYWSSDAAVDAAGRVYVVYHDRFDAYLVSSGDGGDTWTAPRRIDAPPSLAAAYPSVAAGAPGQIALMWFGADRRAAVDDTRAMGPPGGAGSATWRAYVARSRDGGATLAEEGTLDVVHRGAVCVGGDGCGFNDSRALLDLTSTALDPATGVASAAYTDDPDNSFFSVAAAYTTFGDVAPQRAAPHPRHKARKRRRRHRRHRHRRHARRHHRPRFTG